MATTGNPKAHIKLLRSAAAIAILSITALPSASSGQSLPIVVGAAISLKEAFSALGAIYQQRTGTKVTLSFGSSGELERQIEAGAPIDVFASAAEKEMDELQANDLIDGATRAEFVRNSLVLVVPAGAKLRVQSFSELTNLALTHIAIGNPKTVPAGQYAQELLRNLQLWPKLESRLILAENVRQVLDYVARGEVDAGIVYATDVRIAQGRVAVAARAPDERYGPIKYPVAMIRNTANAEAARRFIDLVLSPEGTQILAKFGFRPAK